MNDIAADYASAGAWSLLGVMAFRFFPFAGFLVLTRGVSPFVRVSVAAAYAALAWIATRHGSTPTAWLLLIYLYFATAGWVAYELMAHVRSKLQWCACIAILFWVVPLLVVRPLPHAFMSLGWAFALGACSYGIDTLRRPERSLREFLFFLLVNPVLVYRARGERVGAPAFDAKGLIRTSAGCGAMFLSLAVLEPLHGWALAASTTNAAVHLSGWTALVGMSRLLSEYAAQSGVASLQLGLMRQLGWRVPERFDYPLLAVSPADFWRRWNLYVGDWARTYVFLPVALRLSERRDRARKVTPAIYATGIVLTFAVVGALHDVMVVAASGEWKVRATVWFLAMGCVVVIWQAVRTRLAPSFNAHPWLSAAERALFWLTACTAAAYLWW